MQPAQFKRFEREQFPADVQEWVPKLIQPLNDVLSSLSAAMKNGLSVTDNLAMQVKTLDLTAGSFPARYKSTVSGKIGGLMVVAAQSGDGSTISSPLWADWTQDGDSILLRNVAGIPTGKRYTVSFLTFGASANPGAGTSSSGASSTGKTGGADWQTPTLINGWKSYQKSYAPVGYYKDDAGAVHLRGLLASGTVNTVAFVLPAGFRPAYRLVFASVGNNGGDVLCRNDVDAAGNVKIAVTGGGTTWNSLDGISFRAEA